MEWVETTAKTIDDAKHAALDQLGVAADEAEFDVIDEPRQGLFGRTRGEARVRARVKPAQVRPKNERRRRSTRDRDKSKQRPADAKRSSSDTTPDTSSSAPDTSSSTPDEAAAESTSGGGAPKDSVPAASDRPRRTRQRSNKQQETKKMNDNESPVSPQEVGDAAVAFMDGLVEAFGATSTTELTVEGTELDVAVAGDGLGLLVGPGGRTLNAIQDLARVSAQRRLGDHETRLRIDVAGYRVRRSEALTRFARDVAQQVRDSESARSLEPMSSADRKVVHDALNDEEGVTSSSEGDDPNRRVVVSPA